MKFSICNGAYPNKDISYHLEKVKEHGLDGLEYYRWWNLDIEEVAKVSNKLGVGLNSVCTKYISLVDESLRNEYINGLKETLEVAKKLGITSIVSQIGNLLPDAPRKIQRNAMIETLKQCTILFENSNVILELEPLNALVDHPGYYLQKSEEAVEVIKAVNHPNIKMCFDVYHQQVSEGNVINNMTKYIEYINHIHIADNPGRTELGIGELNYHNILQTIKDLKFDGFIGLECKYTRNTDDCIEHYKNNYINKIFK